MGSWRRTRWSAGPGTLVLGLGFGLQVTFKRTKLVPATMNESGVSQQSTVSLFWSDYKSSLGSRRLNIDCSYYSESQEAEVAQGTGLLQV